MPGSSLNSIVGARDNRRRRPVPATSSVNSIVGARDNRPAPTSQPSGEGIPGSQRLEGAIRGHQFRRYTGTRAMDRIQSILSRAPGYLTDVSPRIELNQPLDDALGTYSPTDDTIRLDGKTTVGLAGSMPTPEPGYPPISVSPRDQKAASQVFLHELVHANQPTVGKNLRGQEFRKMTGSRPQIEGGAEYGSRKIASDLFGFRADTDHPYQQFVSPIRRRREATGMSLRDILGLD